MGKESSLELVQSIWERTWRGSVQEGRLEPRSAYFQALLKFLIVHVPCVLKSVVNKLHSKKKEIQRTPTLST